MERKHRAFDRSASRNLCGILLGLEDTQGNDTMNSIKFKPLLMILAVGLMLPLVFVVSVFFAIFEK